MKRAVPQPVADVVPPPHPICHDVWALDRELRHFGFARLPARTTIVRLHDGRLVVVSPPPAFDAPDAAALDSIGPVAFVVVPNSFHYLFTKAFMARYPGAELLVAPMAGERAADLSSATELGPDTPTAWSGELETIVLGPVRGIAEVLLFHVDSGTLILTDLAFNMKRYPRAIDRFVWRLSGIPGDLGPGRTTRSLLLRDREVASRCLTRMMEWPIERILVAHGEVVAGDAHARLRSAFRGFLA